MVRVGRGLLSLMVGFALAVRLRQAIGIPGPSLLVQVLAPLLGMFAYAVLQRHNGERFREGLWWVLAWYVGAACLWILLIDWPSNTFRESVSDPHLFAPPAQ